MDTQLTTTSNNEEFINQLNAVTGLGGSRPFPKYIKFDAKDGLFKLETKEKNAGGKPVYQPLGKTLDAHIVRVRKMVLSDFNSDLKLYSREFDSGIFEIFDDKKQVVWRGNYCDLKRDPLYNELTYTEVLYIFAKKNMNLYRMKLSGSKLSGWFKYRAEFQNDNPARFMVTMSAGEQLTKGVVDYFSLNFTKGEEIAKETIISRVTDVMNYLNAYEQSVKTIGGGSQTPKLTYQQPQDNLSVPPEFEANDIPDSAINTSIPF